MADSTIQKLHSFLKQNDTKVSSGGTVKSYSHDHGSGDVLCMVHGYPESSFMYTILVHQSSRISADPRLGGVM